MTDMKRKGRARGPGFRGEDHGRAKLTAVAVRQIRALRAAGTKYRILAERFGVSEGQIANLVLGRQWRHIT
jgi:hypothetical protein